MAQSKQPKTRKREKPNPFQQFVRKAVRDAIEGQRRDRETKEQQREEIRKIDKLIQKSDRRTKSISTPDQSSDRDLFEARKLFEADRDREFDQLIQKSDRRTK